MLGNKSSILSYFYLEYMSLSAKAGLRKQSIRKLIKHLRDLEFRKVVSKVVEPTTNIDFVEKAIFGRLSSLNVLSYLLSRKR